MSISIIAAIGENRELGYKGEIPWYIKDDFKRFKELTLGHPVIMGRKTYESIGKPLSGRTNIVISHQPSPPRFNTSGVLKSVWTASLERAIEIAQQQTGSNEIFIIGGGQIYKQAIKYANKLYLTIIKKSFKADTYFPDYSQFNKVIFKQTKESQGYKYTFIELEKQE